MITSLIDALPDTSAKLRLDAKAKLNPSNAEMEVAFQFVIQTQSPPLSFTLQFGQLKPI
eukprot:SAG25_NODE_7031_length_511_cov_0.750000_1_plen_58_part_10